jgi:hypothetical protein
MGWRAARLYFAVVWGLIAFGSLMLILGFDQPLTLDGLGGVGDPRLAY